MNRILLVFEDYGELMDLESTLKRAGFDTLGISSEYSLSEQILSFNPEVVIGAGNGGKISAVGVGKRLKEMTRWQGKSILLFPTNFKPSPQDLIKIRVDMILESPVPPLRMVQVLAKLLGHDEALLLERLNKSSHVEGQGSQGSTGFSTSSTTAEGEAFYVTGKAESDDGDAQVKGGRFTLQDQGEAPSSAEKAAKERMEFRIGERMTKTAAEESSSKTAEGGGFEDVDLKALERELLGEQEPSADVQEVIGGSSKEPLKAPNESTGEAPTGSEAEKSLLKGESENLAELSSESDDELESAQENPAVVPEDEPSAASLDLRRREAELPEKIEKYKALVADIKISPQSTVTRVETRRRQRQLVEEWDRESLQNQDGLRREFTKAMFKK